MDYNFNLRHSHKRMKMPTFYQPPGLERCFSTSTNLGVNPNMTNKLNPLFNLISGFKNNPSNQHKLTGVTPLPSGPFTGTAAMSVTSLPATPFTGTSMAVSCFVGGLVGGENAFKKSQEYCDNFLVNVFLNEYSKPPDKPKNSDVGGSVEEPVKRRTYAEVTKEKPKPKPPMNRVQVSNAAINGFKSSGATMNSLKRETKSCDNLTALSDSRLSSEDPLQNTLIGISKICSETVIFPNFMRLRSSSSSSESSSEAGKRMSRTISESSVESDDSFIVFQSDDVICDSSDEESSDDDDSEEGEISHSCAEKELPDNDQKTSNSPKKKVRWAEGAGLVRVRRLVAWDYASRAARVGPWEEHRRDRERFWRRIKEASATISPVLDPQHRQNVYQERFASL